MSQTLQGAFALITGGHRNLGLAIAQTYIEHGASVLLVGRQADALQEAQNKMSSIVANDSDKGQCHTFQTDLNESSAPRECLDFAVEKQRVLPNVLVNAAGVFVWKNFLDLSFDDWSRTIDTQLSLPFRMTQAFARAWKEAATNVSPSVINIGSIHGPVGDPNVVAQCAAKAGLIGLTRATAEALRPNGIRVNAILAGAIEPDSPTRLSADAWAKITQGDLAQLALYLASDASRGLTGSPIEAYGVTRPVIGSPKKE
jgi:NAD(P)-dependent dehydrogenase (short-subunit alcohol dehydrogenase family)